MGSHEDISVVFIEEEGHEVVALDCRLVVVVFGVSPLKVITFVVQVEVVIVTADIFLSCRYRPQAILVKQVFVLPVIHVHRVIM